MPPPFPRALSEGLDPPPYVIRKKRLNSVELENEKKEFELGGSASYRVDRKIQFAMLKIGSYCFLSTSVYGAVPMHLFHQKR